MVDRNLQNFHGRIGRIERIHNAGGGFEASGALGMSYYNSHRRRRKRPFGFLGPVALVLMTVVVIKAAIYSALGPDIYAERVAGLRAGGTSDQIGAYILQADPLTLFVSAQLDRILP